MESVKDAVAAFLREYAALQPEVGTARQTMWDEEIPGQVIGVPERAEADRRLILSLAIFLDRMPDNTFVEKLLNWIAGMYVREEHGLEPER